MTQLERKINSINRILAATEAYIKKNGINNIDINKICEQAGLTKGAFYHHFKSKQHLLLELLNKWISDIATGMEIPDGKTNTVELLVYIIEKLSPAFINSEKQLPIFLELYIKAISDKNLRGYVLQSYNSFVSFLAAVLKDGIEKKTIKYGDPAKIAKILFSITFGLLVQGLIDPDSEDWKEMAKTSIRMLLLNE